MGPGHMEATMLVNEAMTGKVRWYSPDASMQEVARVMRDESIGCVPIGENDRPVGMTMDRDGVCAAGTKCTLVPLPTWLSMRMCPPDCLTKP
ncbi:CBS domain-containing protein [Mesorhizobium sp. M1182]|uniref:CBS domain-containing protein n=1 Tax=Mesorhizobium sp. M1182 TaxID=2957067 RepID=UPI003337C6B6